MSKIQENRALRVSTPLADNALLLRSMSCEEELGRPFVCTLDLVSEADDIDFKKLVGDKMTVQLTRPDGEIRYFNGYVSRFVQVGFHGAMTEFEATLVPWLWLLTRNFDCRIFQKKTVPDIVKEIFGDRGFSDFEESLTGEYREWEYCVQYRESDFNFVSRLLEQEGIYYYFKHEDGKHTLILSDSYTAHATVPGYEEIPYFPPDETAIRDRDHIYDWNMRQQIQSGTFAHNDFDFEAPNKNLHTKSIVAREHAQSTYEVYNYPGEYNKSSEGETYARIRIEELHSSFETFQGTGDAQGLAVGALFKLKDLPRDDQNKEYLVVSATHQLHSDAFDTDGASSPPVFTCSFASIDSKTPYRAPRSTAKPLIQGPQTAVVSGPSGEEIWTDKYGRVMVQFHWDRYGKSDENSSCWIRVSQLWAGGQWGAIYTPRIGQEVIVEFLEGDPDRPVITGRVYNGSKMPPYALPAEKTKSTIKSNSSKGGGGSNELRFEDKAGSEEVYLHGQKDWTIAIENDKNQTVGHDETLDVGNNRTKTVGVDQSETIGSNKTISVGTDHTETIGANKVLSVGAEHTENVGANMSVTIGADRTLTIAANETISVGANKTETVAIASAETIGAAKALSIGAAYQISVGAVMNTTVGGAVAEEIGGLKSVNVGVSSSENIASNKSVNAGGNISEKASKDVSVSSGKKMSLSAGDDLSISGKKKGVIDIKDKLTIKCGKASITLESSGNITIKGAKIQVKGSGDLIIKGSKILQN